MSGTISELGEKTFLSKVQKYLKKSGKIVRVFSEDCAVIDNGTNNFQLFTTDTLIQGIHYRKEYMPPRFIGRKAVKVNLSDISAMGGRPEYCLISLGVPRKTSVQYLLEIYRGMESAFQETGIALIGGNLAESHVLFLDLFLIGCAPKKQVLFRNGAREGDSIFVTGPLGASAEGFRLLQDGFRISVNSKKLIAPSGARVSTYAREAILSHFDPPNWNRAAQKLASWKMLSSMIDLSDGLASDLAEICKESKAGARVEIDNLPISKAVLFWEARRKQDPVRLALTGGEDYHLLFTVRRRWKTQFLRRIQKEKMRVWEIGSILNRKEGMHLITGSGKRIPFPSGYEHFHES